MSKRRKEPDTMIALVAGVDVVLTLARGKVSKVTFPVDQGGRIDIPADVLRAAVEMLDDVDGSTER